MTTKTFTKAIPAIRKYTSARWLLVSRKTSKIKNKGYSTRALARMHKTGNERIFDAVNATYVR